MFQRFFELKTPLLSSLADLNYDVNLTSEDWQIISQSCNILKRFEEITIEMSSEKSVTISKTILFSQALSNYCHKLALEPQPILQLKSFISSLKSEIDTRFGDYEKNILMAEATFLDPRFKKYGFKNHIAFQEVKKSIINKGKTIIMGKNVQQSNLSTNLIPTSSINKEDSIWNDFDLEVTDIVQSQDPKALIIIEVDKYLQEPIIARTNDPLKWWNENKNVYPSLFEIMKRRFCIQGTSVPSERIFSKSGQVVTEKRNRLTSKRVEQIIFLNSNLE
uniref:Zinc finger BED domain-containing protein 1 n=1 Tax=Schizaphis graminum TaxID=13262 RepID=A0A2S2PPI5_SCHGA